MAPDNHTEVVAAMLEEVSLERLGITPESHPFRTLTACRIGHLQAVVVVQQGELPHPSLGGEGIVITSHLKWRVILRNPDDTQTEASGGGGFGDFAALDGGQLGEVGVRLRTLIVEEAPILLVSDNGPVRDLFKLLLQAMKDQEWPDNTEDEEKVAA